MGCVGEFPSESSKDCDPTTITMATAARAAATRSTTATSPSHSWPRLLARWPEEPTRPGRNIKEFLERRYPTAPNECTQQYAQSLAGDVYKHHYPVPSSFEPVHRPAYQLLSTKARNKQESVTPRAVFFPLAGTKLRIAMDRWRQRWQSAK